MRHVCSVSDVQRVHLCVRSARRPSPATERSSHRSHRDSFERALELVRTPLESVAVRRARPPAQSVHALLHRVNVRVRLCNKVSRSYSHERSLDISIVLEYLTISGKLLTKNRNINYR